MAFYYVKQDGTATADAGRYASQQTGTFAALGVSGYYPSTEAARGATTPPATGDFIFVSDAHDFTAAGNIATYDILERPALVASVSDTAIDAYSSGGVERTGAGADMLFDATGGRNVSKGVGYFIGDNLEMSGANSLFEIEDGFVSLDSGGDKVNLTQDSCTLKLINSDLIFALGSSGQMIQLQRDSNFEMVGGSVSVPSGTADDLVGGTSGTNGGFRVKLLGVDLTSIDGFLLGETGAAATADDNFSFVVHACVLSASLTGFSEENFSSPAHKMLITNSAATSAPAEFQFFYKDWSGDSQDQDDTGVFRAESTAFPSGTQVSIQVTTLSTATITTPHIFDLPARFAELSNASSDTIRIYFASTATLTDTEVWAELIYPDGTSNHIYTYLTNRNADFIATGTEHTDDSGGSDWRDGGSPLAGSNEYRMDLDTSGDVGADSVPTIRIYVAVASATIYFDTTVDVVA